MISQTLLQGILPGNFQGGAAAEKDGGAQEAWGAGGFKALLGKVMDRADAQASSPGASTAGDTPLDKLKKTILASGTPLQDTDIDGQTIASFEAFLLKSGYNPQEIQDFLSTLSGTEDSSVSLSTLFGAASQLSEPDEVEDASVYLGSAGVPTLATVLGALGLAPDTVRSLLAESGGEGGAINLTTLSTALNQLVEAGQGTTPAAASDQIKSALSEYGSKDSVSEENTNTPDSSTELLASYFQQLLTPVESKADVLQGLGAGTSGELDGAELLKGLTQQQGQAATGKSGAPEPSDAQMTLARFAEVLEAKVAAAKQGENASSSAEQFLDRMPASSSVASGQIEKNVVSSLAASGKTTLETGALAVAVQAPAQGGKGNSSPVTDSATVKTGEMDSKGLTSQTVVLPSEEAGDASGDLASQDAMDALAAAGKGRGAQGAEDQTLVQFEGVLRHAKGLETASAPAVQTPRSLPNYLLDQVSRQIVKMKDDGESDITLQLKPPHLGKMSLSIEQTAGGLKVGIVVESSAAKDLLLANSGDLKAALGDQGIRLDKIDVQTQGDFSRSMAQSGQDFLQSGERKGGWGASRQGTGPGESEVPEPLMNILETTSRRLDLVA